MKFGVREICDVTFRPLAAITLGTTRIEAGQPALYIDTAKTSSLEGAATTVYAQGGKGNSRLLAWEGEKTMTFTVEDAMLSPEGFQILSGAGVFAAAATTPVWQHMVADATVVTGGSAKIAGTEFASLTSATAVIGVFSAATGSTPAYYVKTDSIGSVVGTPVMIADSSATINCVSGWVVTGATGLTVGDRYRVDFYVKKTASTQTAPVYELQIEPGTFAGYYYVEASTLFRDQATGKDFPAEIIIPKAKIQSNFTFNLASTGDPSTFSFVMDAFPGTTKTDVSKKVLCAIQIVGDDLTVG